MGDATSFRLPASHRWHLCSLVLLLFLAALAESSGQPVRPTITLQPQSQTVAAGGDVTFVVSANGTLPMNYSWRRNGAVFTNITVYENTGYFTIRDAQTNHAGGWRVGISNIAGPASGGLSSNAVLTVYFPVVSNRFTLLLESCVPANGGIDPGETVTVELGLLNTNTPGVSNVVATLEPGNGVLAPSAPQTYEGLVMGGPPVIRPFTFAADGACGSNIVASLRLWDGTNDLGRVRFGFRLGPANGECCYDAASADLALTMSGAMSSAQPGSTIEYLVTVTNRGPGTATGVRLLNPRPPRLTLVSASSPAGTCEVNESGVSCDLTDLPRDAGTSVTILANLTGPDTSVATTASVSAAQRDDNPANNSATVTLLTPVITTQPQSQPVLALTNVTFLVVASGPGPFAYQWQKSGTNLIDDGRILGAQTATLTVSNILPADAGNYSVTVRNAVGPTLSAEAALMVVPLVAWGDNSYGQTKIPLNLTNAVAVAAGDYHSLGLKEDGTAVAWGYNGAGQTNVPAGLTNVMAIAAGGGHNLALRSNGTVVAWGFNSAGQTNIPAGLTNVMAIAAGGAHNLALRSNGTVVAWGYNGLGQTNVPAGLTNVTAVAAGRDHNLALRSNGTVVAWGYNGSGQTNVPSGLSNVGVIAAGGAHSLALRNNGTVVAWGYNGSGQTNVPAGLSDVIAIAAGSSSSLALKANGTVVAWGSLATNVPAGLSNLVAIAAGQMHHLALLGSSKPMAPNSTSITGGVMVVEWQGNGYSTPLRVFTPELARSGVTAIAAGWDRTVALKNDGSVVAWSRDFWNQTMMVLPVPADAQSGVIAVAAGFAHTVALKSDGTVLAWGDNQYGQCNVPADLFGVIAISAGERHTVVVKNDGTLVAWGQAPPIPLGLSDVVATASGRGHTLALKRDGTVVAWGFNSLGQATVPEGLSNVIAISAGGIHSVALKQDGTVTAWGGYYEDGDYSPIGSPGLTGVKAIASGDNHYLVLKDDGTVESFGTDPPIPPGLVGVTAIAAGGVRSVALVVTNLSIIKPPSSQAVVQWQPARFTTVATGYPLTYQWRKNGDPIPGATDSSYVISVAYLTDAGIYDVVVTNASGSVTSAPAVLTVNTASSGAVVAWSPFAEMMVPLEAQNRVTAIAAGSFHNLALLRDGTVVAWGHDTYGETQVPAGLMNVTAIAAGDYHSLALVADGSVVEWGRGNWHGAVPGLTNVTAIAAGGDSYSLALKSDGTVVAWGLNNDYGQSTVPRWLTDVVAIAAGRHHSLALTRDGAVVAWGQNWYGQCNVPEGLRDVVAIAAGHYHSLALTRRGLVVAWGQNWYGACDVPEGLRNVVTIVAGGFQSCALKTDGAVVGWGEQGQGPANLPPLVAIAAGAFHSLGLVGSGPPLLSTKISGGTAFTGKPYWLSVSPTGAVPLSYQWLWNGVVIPGATNSTLILDNPQTEGSGAYSIAVSNALGSVISDEIPVTFQEHPPFVVVSLENKVGWLSGTASFRVVADGSRPLRYQWRRDGVDIPEATNAVLNLTNLLPNQAGAYSVLVSNAFGSVTSADANLVIVPVIPAGDLLRAVPLPEELTNAVALAAGYYTSMALKKDGSVVEWSGGSSINLLTNVVAVASGAFLGVALKADGAVVARDYTGSINVPPALADVVAVAAGDYHGLALKSDGTVVGWGSVATNVPTGLSNVVAVAAGTLHSVALKADGTVVAWGGGLSGQTAPDLTNVVAIAAGGGYGARLTFALKSDGTVDVWSNDRPTYTLTGLTNVVAIAASAGIMLALREDGTVIGGGFPPGLSNVVAIAAGSFHSLALIGDEVPARPTIGNGRPVLTVQPMSRTVVDGDNPELVTMAVGQGALSYQWHLNGADLVGATNRILQLVNVQPEDSGEYRVIVSNALGAVTSRVARLTVLLRPRLAPLPESTFAAVGSDVALSIEATGTPPLRYQWRKNGANIPGATNATFTLTNAQISDGGSYTVVVANDVGTAVSTPILVIIEVPQQPPGDNFADRVHITTNFVSGTNRWATREAGEPYHAHKFGSNSVWYRWQAPSNGIATFRTVGSTFDTLLGIYTNDLSINPQPSTLNLRSVAEDEDRGGFFTSELRFNAQTNVDYAIAIDGFVGQQGTFILGWTLEPTDQSLPVITNAPRSQTVRRGDDVVLSVSASGAGLTYQWHFNGAAIAGGNTATLALNNVQPQDVGFYIVAITNSAGRGIESLPAVVEIGPFPGVQAQDKLEDLFAELRPPQPPGGPFAPASFVTAFISVAAGSVDYQLFNTTRATTQAGELNHCGVIGGASLWFDFHAENDATVVIDTQGSTFDTVLAVYRKVGFLALATNNVACNTDWRFGAGWSRVMFEAVRGSNYWVVVDGVNPTDLTGRAELNWAVGRLPQSSVAPSFETLRVGLGRRFWAGVTNAIPPPRYQWLRDGQPILNATNEWLDLAALSLTDAGRYTVAVSNALGEVEHLIAQLTAPLLTSELKIAENQYRLTLAPVEFPGQAMVLESSTDLIHWTPVATHTNATAPISLDFPLAPPNRFFRAKPGP